MFLIRNGNEVFNEVQNPYAIFNKSRGSLIRIGEKQVMEDYFEEVQKRYRSIGFHQEADDVGLMELPKDQDEIDKVFQIVDYIGILYKKCLLWTEGQICFM